MSEQPNMKPQEAELLDRLKSYAASAQVQNTPWLDLLMNDTIVEITELRSEVERLQVIRPHIIEAEVQHRSGSEKESK